MLVDSAKVFDDAVSGTSSTWYTSAAFNDRLGKADTLVVHAVTTTTSGTTPTLTVTLEHSGDNEHWVMLGSAPIIQNAAVEEDKVKAGAAQVQSSRFVRMKITLGGTSPKCRLQLYAAIRANAVGVAQMAPRT